MIEIKGISKVYKMDKNQVVALRDISLKINSGEFVAIVGPSGSGKSTLIHLIGGLDTPTIGSIYIDGEDISNLDDKNLSKYRNKKIGFVFQSCNLDNIKTALENVMIPLIFSGVGSKDRKDRALKALELVGLQDVINHRPNEMSASQRQRVSIARAIVNQPKIIFADEPTGNLDSRTGESIMSLFKTLNSKGYTIIMVTHNQLEANKAMRVVKIMDGEITTDIIKEETQILGGDLGEV